MAVKAPVFSMSKLAGVDTFLGPEMKSTGEVMGIDRNYESAVVKALMASGLSLNPGASVLLSVADGDKADAIPLVRELAQSGSRMYATAGTAAMIRTLGYEVIEVDRRLSGKTPHGRRFDTRWLGVLGCQHDYRRPARHCRTDSTYGGPPLSAVFRVSPHSTPPVARSNRRGATATGSTF